MSDEVTTWTDPAGTITTLDVEWGAQGRFMPPIIATEDVVPGQPGSRRRATQHKAKDVLLPLWILSTDASTLRQKTRALVYAFDPTRGDGSMTVTAPDGVQRLLYCRAAAGLEIGETFGTETGELWQRAALVLHANDPYWYDTAAQTSVYTLNLASSTFFPIFPLRLTASAVVAAATINNIGDVNAWPIWTITGPGNGSIVVSNGTTGQALVLTQPLGPTDVLTIDTRPGVKSVQLNGSTNAFGLLSVGSVLWSLAVGNNAITVQVGGASLATAVTLSYTRRYLSP